MEDPAPESRRVRLASDRIMLSRTEEEVYAAVEAAGPLTDDEAGELEKRLFVEKITELLALLAESEANEMKMVAKRDAEVEKLRVVNARLLAEREAEEVRLLAEREEEEARLRVENERLRREIFWLGVKTAFLRTVNRVLILGFILALVISRVMARICAAMRWLL